MLLLVLWLVFSALLLSAESAASSSTITSYGKALYWSVAAMSTAGIASEPQSVLGHVIGGAWMIFGSILFFGTNASSITGYFMRPLQRPARQIVETIEYNLEHLQDLTMNELTLLKETTDALIEHVEHEKNRQTQSKQERSARSRQSPRSIAAIHRQRCASNITRSRRCQKAYYRSHLARFGNSSKRNLAGVFVA